MNTKSLNLDNSRCRIEVFKLKLAYRTTVNRICIVRSETLCVKVLSALAYFLIRRKCNRNPAVNKLLLTASDITEQLLCHSHYLSYSGLVIRSEQRRTIGCNKRLPDVFPKFREFRRTKYQPHWLNIFFGILRNLNCDLIILLRIILGLIILLRIILSRSISLPTKHYIPAVVIINKLWIHILSACFRRGIHMSYKSQHFLVFPAVCRRDHRI